MTTTEDFAKTLKLLGNPTRLRIIQALAEGGCSVTLLCERLDLPQATVSQHLALLRNSDIVSAMRDGARVCYTLSDAGAARIIHVLNETHADSGGTHARNQ